MFLAELPGTSPHAHKEYPVKHPTAPFSTKLTLGVALLAALVTIVGTGAPKTPMHWNNLSSFKQPAAHGVQAGGKKGQQGEPTSDTSPMVASAAVDD